jgi:hypothetical protein
MPDQRLQEPDDCTLKQCSYYQHYLAHGPMELTHDGFHAAERKCELVQKRIDDWMIQHPDNYKIPDHLLQEAERWERRVRA